VKHPIHNRFLWAEFNMKTRCLSLLLVLFTTLSATGEDWLTWRGPRMDGSSKETNLPDSWSPKGENLLWRKEEGGTRSSPVVMNGRVYVVCRAFPETTQEGEKVVCLDGVTGDVIWESIHNVFLSDAPAERVGWSSVVCDPTSNTLFVLGLGCLFQCLDAESGKVKWEHSLSEEYGMLSTYGGRTNFPMVFEDLVIISGVNTGWGETAIPAHRFFAFDKANGQLTWTIGTKPRPEDTTYSTPVFTKLNGQDAMVVGAGDGAVYAFQPRTGAVIWKYQASTRGINTTPLVDEKGIVYCGHAEQNANDTTVLGAIFAFDGNTKGEIPEEKLLWKIPAMTVGRSAPVKLGDRVYFLDDGGALIIVNAKSGEMIDEKKIGRIIFGSLVTADGKLYTVESTGRSYVFKPSEDGVEVLSQERLPQGEEVYGSPAISNGRIYIPTTSALYCVGKEAPAGGNGNAGAKSPRKTAAKPQAPADKKVTTLVLSPAEIMVAPGSKTQLQLRAFNDNGEFVKNVTDAKFEIEGGGEVNNKLIYTAQPDPKQAGVTITAKLGELAAKVRVRVVPKLPWKFDFSDQKVPVTWIGADYRHKPFMLEKEAVLVKISTIPKGTRSLAWLGWTDLHDYTIQADFLVTDKSGNLPDMGLIAQRYTLDLKGEQQLQIRSWTSRLELRFAKTIDMNWSADKWYTMKFQCANEGGKAVLRGKVWPRDAAEPADWQIEAADDTPNTQGSPGLFGNATNAEFYIDNVSVTPN
jgi:outer membrane protein assembly factor BamB